MNIRLLLATAAIAKEIGCPAQSDVPGGAIFYPCIDRNRPDSAGKRECYCENAARKVLELNYPEQHKGLLAYGLLISGGSLIIATLVYLAVATSN